MNNRGTKFFASHYAFMPDGRFGKWPIIAVNESGVIEHVELRDNFKEKPSLEMHPGIILPGFVDIYEKKQEQEVTVPNFNRHFAHGTILLGSKFQEQQKAFPLLTSPSEAGAMTPKFLNRDSEKDLSLLDRMKEMMHQSELLELAEMLYFATKMDAKQSGFTDCFGALREGLKPGVMVLQKIDLSKMRLTNEAQIKWLSVPVF